MWLSLTRRSQYTYAHSIPSAPCAKLKTPDVEYVTTSPLAAIANTAPVIRPLISRFMRVLEVPPVLGDAAYFGVKVPNCVAMRFGVELGRRDRRRRDARGEVLRRCSRTASLPVGTTLTHVGALSA